MSQKPGTMSQPGTFELSGDADLNGSYHFTITGDGSPILKVGGDAKVGGTLFPTFDGVTPAFGDTFTFVEANSVELSGASVELPASVVLPRGLEGRIVSDGKTAALEFGNLPILQVHRATGESKITNVVGGPVAFAGYSVTSARGTLNPDNFSGFGGDGWDRPNPINGLDVPGYLVQRSDQARLRNYEPPRVTECSPPSAIRLQLSILKELRERARS